MGKKIFIYISTCFGPNTPLSMPLIKKKILKFVYAPYGLKENRCKSYFKLQETLSERSFENHLLTFKRTVKKCISGKLIIEEAEEIRNIRIRFVLLLVDVLNLKCWPAKIPICVSFYHCYRFFTLFSGLELFLGETAIPLRGSKLVAR